MTTPNEPKRLVLRPDQAVLLKGPIERLDALSEGFALGIQQAKKTLIQAVLSIPDPAQKEAVTDGNSDAAT